MRSDVVEALKKLSSIPVLRWPGGCFADEYHWKDGIGPKETRKKHGQHPLGRRCRRQFLRHTRILWSSAASWAASRMSTANVGSGTVQEMSEWVEYMTFDGVSPMADLREQNGHKEPWKVKYFGVGNENWGCGGNMRPSYYADEYRRFQTYVPQLRRQQRCISIACGPSIVDDYELDRHR